MKEEKRKNNQIIAIGLTVLLLAIVIVVLLIVAKVNKQEVPKENETQEGQQTEQQEGLEILKSYTAKCEIITENEGYREIYTNNLKVEGDRLLNSLSSVRVEYTDEELYNEAKNDNYGNRVEFNDAEKIIEYIDTEENADFTKDADGNEVVQSYSNYKAILENNGYTCTTANEQ